MEESAASPSSSEPQPASARAATSDVATSSPVRRVARPVKSSWPTPVASVHGRISAKNASSWAPVARSSTMTPPSRRITAAISAPLADGGRCVSMTEP